MKDTQGYNLFFESKKQKDELRQIVTDLNKKGEYVSMKEVILNALKKQYPQLKAIENGSK